MGESHQYTDELRGLNKRISTVEDFLKRVDSRLERIESAILGDDKYGQRGYRDRIEKLEDENRNLREEIKKINKIKSNIYWLAVGISFGGGLLGSKLFTLLQGLF